MFSISHPKEFVATIFLQNFWSWNISNKTECHKIMPLKMFQLKNIYRTFQNFQDEIVPDEICQNEIFQDEIFKDELFDDQNFQCDNYQTLNFL